jgi:hypothetical protein
MVHETGVRAEVIPDAGDKPGAVGRIEVAISLEWKGLDPLPKRKRALVVPEAGDVDANDLGRIADLMSVVDERCNCASSMLRLRPAR